MSFTSIAHTSKRSTDGSNITTDAIVTTGANLLVAYVSSYVVDPVTGVSDSKSNSWNALTVTDPTGVIVQGQFFWSTPTTVGTGHTFQTTGAGTHYPAIAVTAWSGAKAASPFNKENGDSDTAASSLATGSITPDEDSELVLAGGSPGPDVAISSINGGFTIEENITGTAGQAFGVALAQLVQTTATAANPTWTWASGTNSAAAIASFKATTSPFTVLTHTSAVTPDGFSAGTSAEIDTSGADLIVAAVGEYDTNIGGSSAVTDSKGNAWTSRTLYVEGAPAASQVQLWYTVPTSVGSGHSFIVTPPGTSYPTLVVMAVSGAHGTPFDQEAGAEGTAVSTKQPGSVTPGSDSELIVTAVCSFIENVSSIDSGMTIIENVSYGAGNHLPVALAYLLQGAAAAVNPTWTAAGSTDLSAAIATFKATTGAVATNKSKILLLGVGN